MNSKNLLACTAVVIAFALVVAPLALAGDTFAKYKKKSNISIQSIIQSESKTQSSNVASSGNNVLVGNNVNVQNQENTAGNTLVQ